MFKEWFCPTIVFVVTTMYKGVTNGAPITWVTPVSYDPLSLMISVKQESDTAKNILDNGKFMLQTVPPYVFQEVHNMAAPYPRTISEPVDQGLEIVKENVLSVPRLSIAVDFFECFTDRIMETGDHYQIFADIRSYSCSPVRTAKLMVIKDLVYTDGQGTLFKAKPY